MSALSVLGPRWYVSPRFEGIAFWVVVAITWIAPVVVFVVGFDPRRWSADYYYTRGAQADYREIGVRTLFWWLGSVVCWLTIGLSS